MAPKSPTLKIVGSQPEIKGSLGVEEYVEGRLAKYAMKAVWILVGAALAFLLTQFYGLSNLLHEMNGKQIQVDQTISVLLQERRETFTTMMELNTQLSKENQDLREQLNNRK